jgi:type IV pilus assembly protein PilB
MEAALHPWPALGALLMRDGLVTREELEAVLAEQRDLPHRRISGTRLGEVLLERGLVTETQVAQLVAEQYTLPYLELTEPEVSVRAAVLLPEELARTFRALPISVLPDGSLLVAISDPPLAVHSGELDSVLGVPLRFAVATSSALESAIDHAFERARELGALEPSDTQAVAVAAGSSDGDDSVEPDSSSDPASPASTVGLARPWPALGALLVRDEIVGEDELEAALAQQRVSGSKRLGEILVDRGSVSAEDIARLVSEQHDLPFVYLVPTEVDTEVACRLPEDLARRYSAVPVSANEDEVVVALADPTRVLDAHELRAAIASPVRFVGASPDAVAEAIAHVHDPVLLHEVPVADEDLPDPEGDLDDAMVDELLEATATVQRWDAAAADSIDEEVAFAVVTEVGTADAPPTVESVPALLEQVLALGASHVHFTPRGDGTSVRARVDGVLREVDPGTAHVEDTVAWLKAVADLEIGGRRVHRERTVTVPVAGHALDLRLVLVGTTAGEKLTLTAHDRESELPVLSELGLLPEGEAALRSALVEPFGAVIVSGPAGSGRTTTLYALLQELASPARALSTIEQPVEAMLPGADQIEVSPETGLTFGRALRAVLRSDADVVAIGELRDDETTRLTLGASTGHLVLATLESRSAAAALHMLGRSGGETGHVSSAVTCVVSQRLVRRTCADCLETYYPDPDELVSLGRPAEEAARRLLARGRGCDACGHTGYRGRIALFEVLPVSEEIRSLVDRGATASEIEDAAVAAGMRTFAEEGSRLCLEGVTTPSEVRRVLGSVRR